MDRSLDRGDWTSDGCDCVWSEAGEETTCVLGWSVERRFFLGVKAKDVCDWTDTVRIGDVECDVLVGDAVSFTTIAFTDVI